MYLGGGGGVVVVGTATEGLMCGYMDMSLEKCFSLWPKLVSIHSRMRRLPNRQVCCKGR